MYLQFKIPADLACMHDPHLLSALPSSTLLVRGYYKISQSPYLYQKLVKMEFPAKKYRIKYTFY